MTMEEPGGKTLVTMTACACEFDAWQCNPYTKVMQESIDRDYVPKSDLAAANKRADEARAVAIEDVCKLADNPIWANFDDLFSKIRAVAKLPPSHGVVPLATIDLCIGILEDHTTRHNGEDRYRSVIKQLLAARPK